MKWINLTTLAIAMSFSLLNGQEKGIDNSKSQLSHGQLADTFESHLEQVRNKDFGNKESIKSSLEELRKRATPIEGYAKLDLARAWETAAKVLRETEGTTPSYAEALRVASELNPDDLQLARNANFEAIRQANVQVRIDEANSLAKAKSDQQKR